MRKRFGIGVLAMTFVAVTGLVEIGNAGGVADPGEVRLVYGDLVFQESYRLVGEQGGSDAVIELFKGRLLDGEGNQVGTHRCQCINGSGFGWTCTHIYSLRPGPHTFRGTVIVAGIFRGFNGEQAVITGGTGAYAGASGYAVATVDGEEFVHTLYLIG